MNGILVVAHAPLASALRQCVLHVFPDAAAAVVAVDVLPEASPEDSLALVRAAAAGLDADRCLGHVLVLTDVIGATPCNVAQRLVDGTSAQLVSGVNLPMLLRAVSYRHEALGLLVSRAMAGGTQSIVSVTATAPQNLP